MEAYKVWITLNLKGDALKKMEIFTAATKRATEAVDKLKIAMRPNLTMFDQMAVNLREINPELNKMAQNINAIERSSRNLNRGGRSGGHSNKFGMGLAGALGLYDPRLMAGAAVGALAIGSFRQYGNYQTQSNQLAAQGFSGADLAKGLAASKNIHLRGISQNEMLRSIIDIANATGNMSQAVKYAPMLAEANFANKINMGKVFNPNEEAKMIQFAELRGGSDPNKVAAAMNLAQQAFSASSGRILPHELLNFSKMAVTAGYKLSDQGLLRLLPTLQELGGFRAGTGFQSGYNRLVGGVGLLRNKKVVAEGERIGLLNKSGILSSQNTALFQSDPGAFWSQVLKSLYAAKGITSDQDISRENALLLGTTFARFMDTIRKNEDKAGRMLPLHQNAWGIENSYFNALKTNPGTLKNFSAAFESFETSLGKLTSPAVTGGLNTLASIFEWMAKVGNYLSDQRKGNHPQGILGEWFTRRFGSNSITDSAFGKSNKVAGSITQDKKSMNVNVHIDGKKVASALSNHMGDVFNSTVMQSVSGNVPVMPYATGLSNNRGI